jgi:hypothetical protein
MSYCERCGGEGKLYTSKYGGNDPDVWATGECPACDGTGVEPEPDKCPDCGQNLPLLYPCFENGCSRGPSVFKPDVCPCVKPGELCPDCQVHGGVNRF